MGTENERKYVLYCNREALKNIQNRANKVLLIEQPILQKGDTWIYRLRKSTTDTRSIYISTYKQRINSRLIELNHEIEERDYLDLITTTNSILYKIRYEIPYGYYLWEIDVFYKTKKYLDSEIYFIMAEVELEEDKKSPEFIPDFITQHLLYEVPIGVGGFSSEKLKDSEYAKNMYQNLLKEDRHEEKEI